MNQFVIASLLVIVCLAATPARAVNLTEHLLPFKYQYAYGLAAADLNGDKKLEIVSADAAAKKLFYYQRQTNGNFSQTTVAQNSSGIIERMAVGDIDNDGKPDIAIVNNQVGWPNPPDPNHGELWWYKNPGNGGGNWAPIQISAYFGRAYDVAFGDFNGDGKPDLAASSYTGSKISWFENPGDTNLWKEHILGTDLGETRTARVADFNGDGKPDILTTGRLGNKTIWYENTGAPAWTAHYIDTNSVAPTHGEPWDLDGDGDMDVVMALGYRAKSQDGQVVWYKNINKGSSWIKHTVGTLPFAFEAVVGDINGDGKPDIVATAFTVASPGEHVVWFENPGNPSGTWIKHVLKKDWYGANSAIVVDVDGNGKLDIFTSAESTTKEVRWWSND